LIFGILTIKAQKETAIGSFEAYSVLQRFTFLSYGMLEYIYKLFLPINLAALYPYPKLVNNSLPVIFYLTPFIALALFYGVYRSLKYSRLVTFGVLFFLANIVLVLQFLSVGTAIISERYTYVPYIGLFFIIGMGFSWIYRNKDPKYSKYKTPATIVLAIFAITCAYLTSERCKIWFNSEVLWTNEINQFPNDAEGWKNRGGYLVDKSKFDINAGANDFDAALIDFNTSMALNPLDWKNYSNRGHLYIIKQKIDSSIADYTTSIKLNPGNASTYLNRALDYCMKQKYDSAFNDFETVIKMKGDDNSLYINRAYAYLQVGKFKESLADYNRYISNAEKVEPNIYALRGFDNYKLEHYQAAIDDYSKAISMNPNYPEAFYVRSQCYLGLDKFKNAMDDARKAQSLGYPVDPIYMNQLTGLQK
jgi:tetratricopeptide (TPR) repeat protein